MKWLGTAAVVALAFSMLACRRTPPAYPTSFSDGGIAAQNRIGGYFSSSVASRLRGCWSQLQGEGAVAMDVTYRKAGDKWTFEKVSMTKSTLPKGQESGAQRCVEESARDTAFPMEQSESLEKAAEQFVVRLGLPVPLPAEGTQMTPDEIARMIGTGGGLGDIAGCSECVSNPDYPYGLKCESRKSGGHLDCKEHTSNVCSTAPTACLRGLFGGSTIIIY